MSVPVRASPVPASTFSLSLAFVVLKQDQTNARRTWHIALGPTDIPHNPPHTQLKSGGRRLLRKVISSKIGSGARRIDESGRGTLRSNPWLGVRGGPHPGASHQRDCGRRRPILHKCKNHTSSDKCSMEDTKRRRSNERPGVSRRHSQLRSVTGVAVSPTEDDLRGGVAPPACICATVFLPCPV